jgi:hypothetical protein
MPASRAALRRVQCSAKSRRRGERCRRWCPPGSVVCASHGAKSPQAKRSAETRAIMAEVAAAGPRRTVAEIVADSLHLCDVVMRDAAAEAGEGPLSAETVDLLTVSAGRAASMAKLAHELGVQTGQVALDEQTGELIAEVLRVCATELVNAAGGHGQDQLAVREWILRAVPAALRGERVPVCPRPWRSTDLLPALESGEVFRQRESERVSAAVSVREASRVSGSTDGGNGAGGGVHQSLTGVFPGGLSPFGSRREPTRVAELAAMKRREGLGYGRS